MGLAAPKNRSKIGRDPNNTTWSNSTTRFGHRVLISQGWTPGSTLGAENARHEAHYTAASSSHVRVVLKDGNLGIGAKRGRAANDETFGLTLLSGLLGRLNGKSEATLGKEAAAIRDVKLMRYQGEKWGSVGFVSGGYLVGDKIEKSVEEAEKANQADEERREKRKRAAGEEADGGERTKEKPTKRSKKSKKSKQESKPKDKEEIKESESPSTPYRNESQSSEDSDEAKRQRKEEKRARKEARRLKKEQKQLKATQKKTTESASELDLVQGANDRETDTSATPVQSRSGSSTPLFAGGRGRHAIRQKYIHQKQMACMDDKALNEIFMIKSKA